MGYVLNTLIWAAFILASATQGYAVMVLVCLALLYGFIDGRWGAGS